MTDANKSALITWLYTLTVSEASAGTTLLDSALSLAFSIIEASITSGDNTLCYGRGAILVISDFHSPSYSSANLVYDYNRWRRFLVFTYGFEVD